MRADDVIEALDVLDRAGVRYWVGGGGGWPHSPAGARWVDVHPVTFGEDGHGRQAGLGEEHFDYMPSSFTTGSLAGRRVNCLSAEQQRQFRTGYALRPQDLHDLAELDTVQE
jgi:hypothetical protein